MKKIKCIFLIFALLISLCSCGKSANIQETELNEKFDSFQNLLNTHLALYNLMEANEFILETIYEYQVVTIKEAYVNAYDCLQEAKEKFKLVVDSPNFILTDLTVLLDTVNEIIQLLEKRLETFSCAEEDYEQFFILEKEATDVHIRLIKSMQCFSNLYSIRKFDQLPDQEAKNCLKDMWFEFGFENSIECPEKIDEYELYLIWANQFSDNFAETDSFKETLQNLRESDSLSSKILNLKWIEFIEQFILSTEIGATDVAPNFFIIINWIYDI